MVAVTATRTNPGPPHHGTLEQTESNLAHRRAKKVCSSCCKHPAFIDRKSTRLNSSHLVISYAVFCLKKTRFSCGGARVGPCGHSFTQKRRPRATRHWLSRANSGRAGPSAPLFFFNDTATTEIYTLSLHDALPI